MVTDVNRELLLNSLYCMMDFSLKVGKAVTQLIYLSPAHHLASQLKGWLYLPVYQRKAITVDSGIPSINQPSLGAALQSRRCAPGTRSSRRAAPGPRRAWGGLAAPRAPPAGRAARTRPGAAAPAPLGARTGSCRFFSIKGFISSTLIIFLCCQAQCRLLERRACNRKGKEKITALVFHKALVSCFKLYFR